MSDFAGARGFHHIAFRAQDFDASVRFYTEVIGCTPAMSWGEGDGRAVMLDTGDGSFLEIFAGGADTEKPEGALLHFALVVDDCDTVYQRAVAAGAVSTMEPTSLTIPSSPQPMPVRIAFCKGPDGEIVEFFQRTEA